MAKTTPRPRRNPRTAPYGNQQMSIDAQQKKGAGEFDIFDIFGILRRQLIFIILLPLIGGGLAYYKFINTANLYASKAVLYITGQNAEVMSGNGLGASLIQDSIDQSTLANQSRILKSDKVLMDTWNALNNDPERKKCTPNIDYSKGPVVGANRIKPMLQIEVGSEDKEKVNLISVSCFSSDPLEAQVILSCAIEQFEKALHERYIEILKVVSDAIEQGRESIKKDIEAANEDLMNYIKQSSMSFLGDENNNPLLTQLQEMSSRRVDLDYQILLYENRYKIIQKKINGRELADIPDAEIVAILSSGGDDDYFVNTIISLASGGSQEVMKDNMLFSTAMNIDLSKTTEITMEMAKLKEQGIGPENPRMIFLQHSLDELENVKKDKLGFSNGVTTENRVGFFSYAQLLETYCTVLQDRIAALRSQQDEMTQYINSQDSKIRAITEYCQTVESKKFMVESQRELFNTLDRKLDDVMLIQKYGGYQLEVIDPPVVNNHPVSPKLQKMLMKGLIIGLAFGCGLAFLLDFMDTTFRTPQEVSTALGMPIMAQFPEFSTPKLSRSSKRTIGEGVPVPALFSYHTPNDPQNEIFRVLRTKLFYNPTGVNYQVVQCTSPHPGDGKTMFLCNMAIKLANAGKKTLLLDCDFRKPNVHTWFNLKNENGFTNVLTKGVELEEALKKTAIDNLYILSAGTARRNPAELLTSEEFDLQLAHLRKMFEVILIDSPPLLYVSDPCIISPKVDGVIYSLRIRRRSRTEAIQGAKMLADVGTTVIGCIINCFEKHRFYNEFATPKEGTSYGSNYGYGSSYGYGAGYGGNYGYGVGYGKKYGYGVAYGDHTSDEENPENKKPA